MLDSCFYIEDGFWIIRLRLGNKGSSISTPPPPSTILLSLYRPLPITNHKERRGNKGRPINKEKTSTAFTLNAAYYQWLRCLYRNHNPACCHLNIWDFFGRGRLCLNCCTTVLLISVALSSLFRLGISSAKSLLISDIAPFYHSWGGCLGQKLTIHVYKSLSRIGKLLSKILYEDSSISFSVCWSLYVCHLGLKLPIIYSRYQLFSLLVVVYHLGLKLPIKCSRC